MDKMIDFFNNLAPKWDEMCTHNPQKIQTLLNLIPLKKHTHILDVGCGTGILESFLLEYDPEKIVAVDIAEKMIEEAKKKYQDPRIAFKCTDVMALNDEQYDYILIYSAFPHFKNEEQLLQKLDNLLKSEGKLVICHSQSRQRINAHHEAKALEVSQTLPHAKVLAEQMSKHFSMEIIIDNEDFYMVVGKKQDE